VAARSAGADAPTKATVLPPERQRTPPLAVIVLLFN